MIVGPLALMRAADAVVQLRRYAVATLWFGIVLALVLMEGTPKEDLTEAV